MNGIHVSKLIKIELIRILNKCLFQCNVCVHWYIQYRLDPTYQKVDPN